MDIATLMVVLVLMYFTVHILRMTFIKKDRAMFKQVNEKLDELRSKPIKTIEEQKEFLNIKHPKRIGTFKWSWIMIPKFLISIIIYMFVFQGYAYLFNMFNITFVLWQSILILIFLPLFINIILVRFGIQKGDISVFFRGGRRK